MMTSTGKRIVALTVAGSDSGGGAGIQADLKTFHAFGVFGTSAITAITAQNTRGVFGVETIDPELVARQIEVVVQDLRPRAVKSGMLADAPIIDAVADALAAAELEAYVLDPVMVAKSGDRLLEENAVATLGERLLGLAAVVTPNIPEAEILASLEISDVDDMHSAAEALVDRGAGAALVKGGHRSGDDVVDVLFDGREHRAWTAPRIETPHTHGTGCTLSAAICAGLARGRHVLAAVEAARAYTRRAIQEAPGLGAGHGPLNHWAAVD